MGLGSGIPKKPIPDPGSRVQKDTGSRIRIRNTAGLAIWNCIEIKAGSGSALKPMQNFGSKALL
jgi:hypothetical protein